MSAAERVLDGITVGDHLCCMYDNPQAALALAVPFLKAGLEKNELCVYIAEDTPPPAVLDALAQEGVPAADAVEAGRLSVLPPEEFYIRDGMFAPERVLEAWTDLVAAARRQGYAGVRGAGEVSWTMRGIEGSERLAEYEAKLDETLAGLPATVLCLYNRGRLPEHILFDMMKTHPLIVLGDRRLWNPEYVPPAHYLGSVSPREMLEGKIRRIQHGPQATQVPRRILGASPQMRRTLELVEQVAPTDSSVLITGETGTGKELVAEAIHYRSARRNGPFVKVNCAAVPRDLLEVELFGHERGAFTDAFEQRPGRFELADGGTLMLDEVGEMPPEMQVKLLRVLQEREFERVGGRKPLQVDIRVLALTNQELLAPRRAVPFRSDLYYRLNVIAMHLPPLRERPEDVPILATAFLARICQRMPRCIEHIDDDAMEVLLRYDWPGNVRELENAIERAVVLSRDCRLSAADFDFLIPGGASSLASLAEVEAHHIARVLRIVGGNRSKAANVLGIHRDTLYRKMRSYQIA